MAVKLQELLPIITTLLGGILAVVGGFVSNYLLKSEDKKTEKKKFYREKLENAYLLHGQLIDFLNEEYAQLIARKNLKQERMKSPLNDLLMIVNLYHPDLKEHTEKIKNLSMIFYSRRGKYIIRLIDSPEDLLEDELPKVYEPLESLSNQISQDFLTAIEQKINQYIQLGNISCCNAMSNNGI